MSTRHHVASLGAVMLALAVGIVAGVAGSDVPGGDSIDGARATTPGTGTLPSDPPTGPPSDGMPAATVPVSADDVLAGSLPAVVAGTLDGTAIAVMALGDAAVPSADLAAADIEAAGGQVVVRATLDDSWADAGATSLRAGLSRQLGGTEGGGDSAGADTAALVTLLAAAVAGAPEEPAPGITRSTVWGVLTGAGLVAGPLDATALPTALVLVAPTTVPEDTVPGWTSLVAGLAAATPALVTAPAQEGGDTSIAAADATGADESPDGGSLVLAVRGSTAGATVSTVDHASTGLGRVAVIRAAAGLPDGDHGHYGSLQGAVAGAPDGS